MIMDKPMNVCVLVGSLRKASFNRMLANALISLAPSSMKFDIVELGQLPLYNEDLETAAPPAPWTAFRQRVKAADAVLFVTPEYNRSLPAALKNALDVGSRPYGSSVWDRKPGAIVSGSPGAIAGFGANHHLRQSLVFLNVPTMQQPEAYIGQINKLFDEQGRLVNDGTRKFLQAFMQAFANWVETIVSQGGASDGLRQARATAAAG
jgi:chromate reductase, NAD(P)H dehydrogenase (quinone)